MPDDLRDGEEVLTDAHELLWRNAHPSILLDGDRLSSQLFKPTPKDQGMLSTARSAVVTAKEHFLEYTECARSQLGRRVGRLRR